jgi:hypothetical protein
MRETTGLLEGLVGDSSAKAARAAAAWGKCQLRVRDLTIIVPTFLLGVGAGEAGRVMKVAMCVLERFKIAERDAN